MRVVLRNVCKDIKGARVLDNVNLELESGMVYGFKGKNGSGKTMLMRAISGLIKVKGEIEIDGKILGKDFTFPPSIGILIENPSFVAEYTGLKNLEMLACIKNKIEIEDIRHAMEQVGLDPDDKRTYKKYSLGMKQKLGIAAAFMEKPDIIILNLDEKEWNNDNLPKCLLWLKEKGLTINFTRDIRSYTKLIPTLKLYPNEIIISVDDDIVYSKHLIKSLFNEYTRDSNAIWAIRTCDKNDYKKVKWRDKEYGFRTNHLLGTGGVLYPPHSLNDKVFEEKVWTKVAPIDDDIWFFMMGLLNGFDTKQVNTANRVYSYEHDLFYQIMHKGSRLKDHLKIDNALNDIINHYHIDLAKLSCQSVKNRIKSQLPLTQL